MKDQLRTLDFRLRDPVRIFKFCKTISFHHNLQVENGHLFRLKTFTDRVVEARKVEERIEPDLFKNLNNFNIQMEIVPIRAETGIGTGRD